MPLRHLPAHGWMTADIEPVVSGDHRSCDAPKLLGFADQRH